MTINSAVPFSRADRMLITVTWLTYASFYLGRLNISPALPVIANDLNMGLGRVGLLGTVFFISYAVGQMVISQVGNSVSPRLIITVGLLTIACANLLFAFQTSFGMMLLLWGINGVAQAAGWGPMLRILSSHLQASQVSRISTFFSITFQIGTAVAWGLAGVLVANGTWQRAFGVPGIILIGIALLWFRSGIDAPANRVSARHFTPADIFRDLSTLLPVVVVAMCIGFVYIGILLWLPTLILEWQYIPSGLSQITTALVPLVGIPGMLLAGALLARQSDVRQTILMALLALLVCLIVSYFSTSIIQGLAVLATVMVSSGLAGLLLSSAPLLLSEESRVSSAGGLLTAVWSIAGGFSGTIIGSIVESRSWSSVILVWIGLTITAIVSLTVVSGIKRLN